MGDLDDLMTPDEAAALLRVKRHWLYDQCRNKAIPHVRVGRLLRFHRRELEAYVASQHVAAV